MVSLFVSLALLGLAAVDPIGIAAMPILLVQKHPFARCFAFLGGSFVALIIMGLLFANGLGAVVLAFENAHAWLVPSAEIIAGLVLLVIAATMLWRIKAGRHSSEPSDSMVKRLRLGLPQLFIFGALLVAVQSVVDVVFVIAMIRIGQIQLTTLSLVAAVVTYATTALVLQFAVVVAYVSTPDKQRQQTLDKIHDLLVNYADQALITVSLGLACGLLINGSLALAGAPHL